MGFQKITQLFLCLLLCLSIGWIGGILTQESVDTWYKTVQKAPWTPPNIVFPIVWTILYLMIGISLWLLLQAPATNKKNAYIAFGLQLFFNFIWSYLFFYLKNPLLGLLDIILLWFAIIGTIALFLNHSRSAAYLLIPYFLWVSYAFSLNLYIWINN